MTVLGLVGLLDRHALPWSEIEYGSVGEICTDRPEMS
jgi:hypothetical protein